MGACLFYKSQYILLHFNFVLYLKEKFARKICLTIIKQ